MPSLKAVRRPSADFNFLSCSIFCKMNGTPFTISLGLKLNSQLPM
uniref:Uncharacterized protein n=1 Tax=virus sp. ctrcb4 TaxID=2825824 RepID=A0A8S5RPV4_9VIRU|nr:MAG TPA: hypothetical protein [virus sp. ctrcb4]